MNNDWTPTRERILAIDPTPKGFGFVVIEIPNLLVDWGVARVWPRKRTDFLTKVDAYIDRYRPVLIVMERLPLERRRKRTRELLERLAGHIRFSHHDVAMLPGETIRRIFERYGKTKRERAVAISESFPELSSRLPRVRKPWMSEDERMNIFDAMALVLTALALPTSELRTHML